MSTLAVEEVDEFPSKAEYWAGGESGDWVTNDE